MMDEQFPYRMSHTYWTSNSSLKCFFGLDSIRLVRTMFKLYYLLTVGIWSIRITAVSLSFLLFKMVTMNSIHCSDKCLVKVWKCCGGKTDIGSNLEQINWLSKSTEFNLLINKLFYDLDFACSLTSISTSNPLFLPQHSHYPHIAHTHTHTHTPGCW